ncbi:hypothetical protein UCRPC4_g05887 [Phaeomoniella chlamydospora]|uniref:Uncharacterized protein n=1 Tax=Phaeomoniella chlamydospora TaxID=158046 RepID=A0A0G2GHU5_PHACM|nr:hypothetical protein UCRPC4_g05887 [Phaeomoniella chlamydospora]
MVGKSSLLVATLAIATPLATAYMPTTGSTGLSLFMVASAVSAANAWGQGFAVYKREPKRGTGAAAALEALSENAQSLGVEKRASNATTAAAAASTAAANATSAAANTTSAAANTTAAADNTTTAATDNTSSDDADANSDDSSDDDSNDNSDDSAISITETATTIIFGRDADPEPAPKPEPKPEQITQSKGFNGGFLKRERRSANQGLMEKRMREIGFTA